MGREMERVMENYCIEKKKKKKANIEKEGKNSLALKQKRCAVNKIEVTSLWTQKSPRGVKDKIKCYVKGKYMKEENNKHFS